MTLWSVFQYPVTFIDSINNVLAMQVCMLPTEILGIINHNFIVSVAS